MAERNGIVSRPPASALRAFVILGALVAAGMPGTASAQDVPPAEEMPPREDPAPVPDCCTESQEAPIPQPMEESEPSQEIVIDPPSDEMPADPAPGEPK